MTQTNTTNEIRERVTATSHKMLDAIDHILDRLAPPAPRLGAPPPIVARRQLANILRLSAFCAHSKCRRSGCCRGEPLHCLQIAIPLLPPDAFAGILTRRKRHRRSVSRNPTPVRPRESGDPESQRTGFPLARE